VIVQIGALGGWVPTDELAEVVAAACARDPRTTALILTQSPSTALVRALEARRIGPDRCVIRGADPAEVPAYLHAADVGLALYKPGAAKAGSSPTKFAEYLAAGLPVFASGNVGDMDKNITADRTGVVLSSSSPEAIADAWARMEELEGDPETRRRCRLSAETRFHLQDVAGVRYRRLYEQVLERSA
jgi:glycosyltransferase involved in cell wall biosynthesis